MPIPTRVPIRMNRWPRRVVYWGSDSALPTPEGLPQMSRLTRRSARLAATAAVAALALAGCTGGGGETPGATTGAAAGGELPAPTGTALIANSTAQLGTVVVDGVGWTLYRSDADSADPPASNCADACAQAWPPLLAEPGSPLIVEGVDQADIGTLTRGDGTTQVTLGGWPLYRHAADPAPGSTDGNGVDGAWFAVTPSGEAAG